MLVLARSLPSSPIFPYTTLFRSARRPDRDGPAHRPAAALTLRAATREGSRHPIGAGSLLSSGDRKSTRLNSSHVKTSYAVFCLKKMTAVPLYLAFLHICIDFNVL